MFLHTESGTSMVCDDGPQYENVKSPILNEGFEVLTPGVLQATNTSIGSYAFLQNQ